MIYTQLDDIFPEDWFDPTEAHCIETYGRMENCVTSRIPREVHAPHDFKTRDTGYVSPASLGELQHHKNTPIFHLWVPCQ